MDDNIVFILNQKPHQQHLKKVEITKWNTEFRLKILIQNKNYVTQV